MFESGYGEELSDKSKAALDRLAVEPSEENLSNVLANESCEEFVHHYAYIHTYLIDHSPMGLFRANKTNN